MVGGGDGGTGAFELGLSGRVTTTSGRGGSEAGSGTTADEPAWPSVGDGGGDNGLDSTADFDVDVGRVEDVEGASCSCCTGGTESATAGAG